jgi:hypothetical protein
MGKLKRRSHNARSLPRLFQIVNDQRACAFELHFDDRIELSKREEINDVIGDLECAI